MRMGQWTAALGLALATASSGCAVTAGAGPPGVIRTGLRAPWDGAGRGPPGGEARRAPGGDRGRRRDPCADPDMLDGLDDPCWVDVPEAEVWPKRPGAVP
jgi:hypothetical protein